MFFTLVFWAASFFFQFRSVSVSISIIRHAGLFFRSYSGNLPAMLYPYCSWYKNRNLKIILKHDLITNDLSEDFAYPRMVWCQCAWHFFCREQQESRSCQSYLQRVWSQYTSSSQTWSRKHSQTTPTLWLHWTWPMSSTSTAIQSLSCRLHRINRY